MKKLCFIGLVLLFLIVAPAGAEEWNWAVDGWDGWSHCGSWTGTQTGSCSEYGPIVVDGVGEHGTFVYLNAGTTSSSVERTFRDPTGNGWDSFIFKGSITASDVPSGRWVTIEVNGQPVFSGDARSSPPGNGQDFEIQGTFPKSNEVKIKISNGQNPAWREYFLMRYYSLKLTPENQETPVPEFPSTFLPATMIIGFLGAVLLIQRTREH